MFIIEMLIGVIPATVLSPIAILGALFLVIGAANDWTSIFHPYGLMGLFGLAGAIGLWFVVPQNAFKKNFTPDNIHLGLLGLGALATLPIIYVFISTRSSNNSYILYCLIGPLIVAIKYIFYEFRRRYLTNQ